METNKRKLPKIRLELTQKEISVLKIALFEYACVCESESDIEDRVVDGAMKYRSDEKSYLYKFVKSLDKLALKINSQVNAQHKKQNNFK